MFIVIQQGWKQSLKERHGLLVTWDPADDEAGLEHARAVLIAEQVRPDQMFPAVLEAHAVRIIDSILESLPDLRTFAEEVQTYQGTPVEDGL